jgi:hypothetical protein
MEKVAHWEVCRGNTGYAKIEKLEISNVVLEGVQCFR